MKSGPKIINSDISRDLGKILVVPFQLSRLEPTFTLLLLLLLLIFFSPVLWLPRTGKVTGPRTRTYIPHHTGAERLP